MPGFTSSQEVVILSGGDSMVWVFIIGLTIYVTAQDLFKYLG